VQYLFRDKVYYSSVTQWVVPFTGETAQFIIDVIIPVVCMSLTSLSSLLTMGYLIKIGTSARRRSSVTILLMSAGVILWNLMLSVALTPKGLPIDHDGMLIFLKKEQYEMYYVYYMMTCFFPVLLAVYNSFVVVVRSSEIREFVLRAWVRVVELRTRLLEVFRWKVTLRLPGSSSTDRVHETFVFVWNWNIVILYLLI